MIKNNCIPILIDCDKTSWNMKLSEIKKKINNKTKCIIATHIYGYPLEIEKIKSICKKRKLFSSKMLQKCSGIVIKINNVVIMVI